MNIMVILGSSRQGRQGEKVAKWVEKTLGEIDDVTIDFVDVAELNLPFYDEPMPPLMAQGKYNNAHGTAWAERVGKADGFVVVTPEYNHSFPAVLKNAIDWVAYGWFYKPVGIVSYGYGSVAGARATEQLRLVFNELRAIPLRDATHIPGIFEAFDADGEPSDATLNDNLKATFAELTIMVKKLKA